MLKIITYALFISGWINTISVQGQIFNKVTSATNPIVTDPVQTYYNGASWIDYDNDGLLDLFVTNSGLYHNDGNGNFTKVTTSGIGLTTGIGNTWADVDNDGDIDCIQSGGNAGGTKLFLNNGNSTFTQNTNGPFAVATKLRGWGSAFGDYNNDGLVDLFIAAPFGFAGITDSCKFLINTGGGNFVRVDSTVLTNALDAFTVPTWSDYDNDGDVDLFIGSGRVNGSLSRDYLYDNNHTQGSSTLFSRNNSTPLGTGLHDGQVWNWIDFDNDGDLDAYLTNYKGTTSTGYPNEMYRNDNGTFVKLTFNDVGPIVSNTGVSLSSTWGDFDNDGDLDCIVTNEEQQKNVYYQNNIRQGSNVFTKINNEPFTLTNGDHWCASSADYDNDGDLDLFISGNSDKGLFENTTTQTDFINIKLVGVTSNKSAIGAKVRVKAHGFWQMREISSQNTFNGMNMLNAHFGFGSTGPIVLYVDSIKIEWPSGQVDICTNVLASWNYVATEGQCLVPAGIKDIENQNKDFFLVSAYPNPANAALSFNYTVLHPSRIKISIINAEGKNVLTRQLKSKTGNNTESLDIKYLANGTYTLVLFSGEKNCKTRFIKQ
ncbi:MAG: FG-GAP-like repeat-containing protein [Bacteroidota bacterium]